MTLCLVGVCPHCKKLSGGTTLSFHVRVLPKYKPRAHKTREVNDSNKTHSVANDPEDLMCHYIRNNYYCKNFV